jgi:4-hydroxymandelate oxidase
VSPVRRPRRDELVNVLEFEEVARLALDAAVYATIAGSHRAAFDRLTFRPRMMVPTLDLDLGVELFGEPHVTPMLVGPVADQRRYHADGELATVRGASAAGTAVIVSGRSSVPIGEIAPAARTPLWCSVTADDEAEARRQIDQARKAGCKVVCITSTPSVPPNWKRIAAIRRGVDVPIVVKGVMTLDAATTAIAEGANGIVVSDHGAATARSAPIEIISSIADALAGKAAVLIDGSFRRGSDITKALILGAHGVLLARPVMWGLAAYGADGVQGVLEMLQSDLARNMGALGAPNLKSLTRNMVRLHRR